MLPSKLTNTIELFIGMKHISPTFRYIMPMYLRLTTFTKTLPQMSFHLFCLLWGSNHNSDDCWSAHRSPAARETASNVCTADARLGGVGRVPPPQSKILAMPVGDPIDNVKPPSAFKSHMEQCYIEYLLRKQSGCRTDAI